MIGFLFDTVSCLRGHAIPFLLISITSGVSIVAACAVTGHFFRAVNRDKALEKRADEGECASFRDTDPNPVVECGADGKVIYLNRSAARLFPGLAAQGPKHPYLADLPLLREALLGEGGRTFVREVKVGGLWYRQELHRSAETARLRVYGFDVTCRRRMDEALRQSEEKYRTLFETMLQGVLYQDAAGRIISVNRAACSILGISPASIPEERTGSGHGEAVREDGSPLDASDHPSMIALREGREVRGMVMGVRAGDNEPYRWLSVNAVPQFRPGEPRPYQVYTIFDDITERRKAEGQILYLNFHDKTTGLYNRTYFEEELKRLDTKRGLPISLIMGDVNNLKLANDAFGHQEGDRLLIRIAGILKDSCRNEDVVARWGGDEFIILLPKTDERTAFEIVKRIRRDCAGSEDGPVKPAIALGIATKDKMGVDIHEVLKEAEDRMYRNKLADGKSGRNAVISSLLKTLRGRTHESSQHTQRLRKLVLATGAAAGFSDSQLDELSLLSVLHDIGKVAISDDILRKPGPLTAKEWKTMTAHPEVGYRIAQSSNALAHIADAILAHHERWDGAGYPQGLKKNGIPLLARLFTIADAFDVMTHGRPYERPVSQKHALEELAKNAGSQFDPELVRLFINTVSGSRANTHKETCLSPARI